jgi:peptidoglycan hydrolase-like protein with peptidoglycan-binding domain
MAKPTRKQPDRRKSPTAQKKTGSAARGASSKIKATSKSRGNIVIRAASGMGRLALRNPAIFGGSAAFAVIFGFVAANALWYQPGHHPSPLMRTRLPFTHPDASRVSMNEPQNPTAGKVTTFVIKREAEMADAEPDAVADAIADAALPTQERTASVPAHETLATLPAEPQPRVTPDEDMDPAALVRAVQAELVRHGVYEGDADGRLGPKTVTAIRHFEQSAGRPQTGLVTADLLLALRGTGSSGPAGVRPAPRPTAVTADIDPIAAAIRAAEGAPAKASPPAHPVKPTETAEAQTGSAVVMSIQRGLANLAYTDVSVDGVAGDQTRAAIRHFEKHYRLPETGEPSDAVLKKMKEIGAI